VVHQLLNGNLAMDLHKLDDGRMAVEDLLVGHDAEINQLMRQDLTCVYVIIAVGKLKTLQRKLK